MVYSTQKAIDRAFENKLRKLKLQAKAQHPDVKLAHPDFTRDMGKDPPNDTLLKTFIKQEKEKHIKILNDRRAKLGERL